jgi:eukaryotic-like serine/threonine-protein kinase
MDYRRLTRQDFKLEMLLGLGRSSQVYLALAPDGTKVALKVPRREVRTEKALSERFSQEVALSLMFNHKYLVRAISGRPEGEGAFLALEYFDEGTLEDTLKHGPFGRDMALECLLLIAEAVLYLHGRGVVHQDIKPSNVFVDGMSFKLGDFGVAKTRENPKPLERAGSPFYMAPELFMGRESGTASDAYSFGILAYELLVGRRPYVGESLEEISYAHMHLAPAPTNLPPYLDKIVRALMVKEPDNRATIKDFVKVVQDGPVVVEPEKEKAAKPKGLLGGLFKKR